MSHTGWFEYVPNTDDFDYWGMHPSGVGHQVARWPRPGSPRVDARFRMLHGNGGRSSASRFLLRIRHELIVEPPTAATKDVWALMDLVPISGGHIEGTSLPNPDNLVLRVSVQDLEELPDFAVPGVRIEIELSLADNGSVIYWENWREHPGSTGWHQFSNNWVGGGDTQGWIIDPLWTYGNFVQKYQSASECYDFPQQSFIDPGFAEFNGLDSYIELSHNVNAWSLPFRLTCEFRIQGQPDWMPFLGNFNAGGFFGMDEDDLIWGNIRRDTSWTPNVGEFHTFRLDFEQTGQLGWQVYIDDINVMDATIGRQFSSANRLGVYRQGGTGTIWGHFDMKHLKYLTGTVGNFTTVLDMPLQLNARDHGPQANHGTTFNMDLPSL